jgi:iron complex outermembrane recepter protein
MEGDDMKILHRSERRMRAVTALLAGLATFCSTVTSAQQVGPSSSTEGRASDALTEIVVTAERRPENLQTTPIAVTVLSAEELVQKGVVQMSDLQTASPSLSISPAGLTASVNIRGIGLDSGSPAVVPGVATYREGLWQPPILTTDSFYDIGSVEILRGPQGTFVGSNSTGGAIFINSRSPDFNGLHGEVQAEVGNYSEWATQGAVNLPIDGQWAARVAFAVRQRDTFYSNAGSQLTASPQQFNPPGALDEKNVRFGLLGKPIDDLSILLKIEVNDKSTGGYAYKPVPTTEYAPYASPDPFTLNYDHFTLNDELGVRGSLKIDWDIGGSGLILRSLTGDQFMRVHNVYDIDATSSTLPGPPALVTTQAIIERPLSQEFNLISPSTGSLQWIVGTFYLHDIREVVLNIQSQAIPNSVVPNFTQILESAAVFGQVSYEIVPRLQLQAGLRYTSDRNSVPSGQGVTIILGIPGVPPIFVNQSGKETDSATTGKVSLNWTLNDANFLYAFVAKGFKAGGFNAGSAAFPQSNFAPETVWDYELGWKANFFDDHLRTSVGGFFNNYTNLQVGAFNPITAQQSLVNTGKSTIKGGEFELHGRFDALHVDAGGAYVNSRLGAISLVNTEALPPGTIGQGLPQCAPGQMPPGCFDYNPYIVNLEGSENPFSPQWTFNAGVEYDIPVGSGTLTPRINYSYIAHQWTTLFEDPVTDYLGSQNLWSASLTYQHKEWRVQAYGLNLADKVYVTGQTAYGQNPNSEFFGNPRQFGLRVYRDF